jgi:amino acid transporter
MVSTIVIIASILIASNHLASNDFVWFAYHNDTGLNVDPDTLRDTPSQRFYICCIGLLMCLFSFSGYEGGAHMAEETTNASISAPRGIILTCIANALTGFTYILGLLYASGC